MESRTTAGKNKSVNRLTDRRKDGRNKSRIFESGSNDTESGKSTETSGTQEPKTTKDKTPEGIQKEKERKKNYE